MVSIKFPKFPQSAARLARDLADALRSVQGATVHVRQEPDADGRVDCECRRCGEQFKVEAGRWQAHETDVFCVYQGHSAPKPEWLPASHLASARQAVIEAKRAQLQQIIAGQGTAVAPHGAIESFTRDANGRDRLVLLPLPALELLRSGRTCPACGCGYSFVGVAYFCPLCGHQSAEIALRQLAESIRTSLPGMPGALAAFGADQAAQHRQYVLEYMLISIVGTFESVGNELYRLKTGESAPKLTFQRLSGKNSGNELWLRDVGHSYEDHVGAAGVARLTVCFQMRHVLSHCRGIVDADYVAKSHDATYRVGERLRVAPADLLEFVGVVERLVAGMRSDL